MCGLLRARACVRERGQTSAASLHLDWQTINKLSLIQFSSSAGAHMPPQPRLTVSHLARARSSSNLANSLLSWMVTSSFQISSAARPRNKIAPATDSSTTRMSGPLGQSARREEEISDWLAGSVQPGRSVRRRPDRRESDLKRPVSSLSCPSLTWIPFCFLPQSAPLLNEWVKSVNSVVFRNRHKHERAKMAAWKWTEVKGRPKVERNQDVAVKPWI